MQFDWQTIAALIIVIWASIQMARMFVPSSQSTKPACGSCHGCSQNSERLYDLR
jgi:cytochrome c553